MLATEPDIDGVREYLGGVLYTEPGVAGAEPADRPSNFRWPGVRGMSDRSSGLRKRGRRATPMLTRRISSTANHTQPA